MVFMRRVQARPQDVTVDLAGRRFRQLADEFDLPWILVPAQMLLRELLDFTRGNYSLDLEHHRLSTIVERALHTVNTTRAKVQLDVHIPTDLIVTVDSERLRRVFENLLSNAVQAMSNQAPPRLLTVRAAVLKNQLRVDVVDSGPGVPPEIRDRLFEPFVSQGKLGGTGLGLKISKTLIEGMNGTIGFDSEEGHGAIFWFTLPVAA